MPEAHGFLLSSYCPGGGAGGGGAERHGLVPYLDLSPVYTQSEETVTEIPAAHKLIGEKN